MNLKKRLWMAAGLSVFLLVIGTFVCPQWVNLGPRCGPTDPASVPIMPPEVREASSSPIVTAARSQIGVTVTYDPAYVGLSYPGGDVPRERGVCTDVVIRTLRDSLSMDLQKLLHEDMKSAFSVYPRIWGLSKPDKNIDHRRVPNLMRYFERRGYSVAVTDNPKDYLPGDLVTCTVGRNLAHIMLVSDRRNFGGIPLVIHNIGGGAKEEDRLFSFPITGHYRLKAVESVRGSSDTEQVQVVTIHGSSLIHPDDPEIGNSAIGCWDGHTHSLAPGVERVSLPDRVVMFSFCCH